MQHGVKKPGAHDVAILMGTYNGARYLGDQLASFAAQTYSDWSLIVRDDGSRDASRALVTRFARQNPRRAVRLVAGRRLGFVQNFLTLLALEGGAARFVAFSDQDDYWLPEKLERAVDALSAVPEALPAVYCGRTIIADSTLNRTGLSPCFIRPPSFRNALVQTIAGGNTMMLNRAARMLVHAAGVDADVVSHDWWIYQLVSGAGGRVIYDPAPQLLYRQHGLNVAGSNLGLAAKLARGRGLVQGHFRRWNDRNLRALSAVRPLLTADNRAILVAFQAARAAPAAERVSRLLESGVHRQTRQGQASLLAAAALGMI